MKKWILDTHNSEINFKANHILVSTITGTFTNIDGNAESVDDTFSCSRFLITIQTDSITAKTKERHIQLKSLNFFNTPESSHLTFKSTSGIQNNTITGILALKGINQEITLNVDLKEMNIDLSANKRAEFEFTGKINRNEVGINWNGAVHNSTLEISNEIAIKAKLEFIELI